MRYILRYAETNNMFRRVTFIKRKLVKFSDIAYMTQLSMQFFRLNETCRMIGYSLLSNNVNFVEIRFEWLCRKTMFFVCSNANIIYKIHK